LYGAPSIKVKWGLSEQESFLVYLKTLPSEIGYPQMSSFKSSNMFEKLVNSVQMNFNPTLSDEERFQNIYRLKSIVYQITSLYTKKHSIGGVYSEELAYLYGMQLQTSLYSLRAANKLLRGTAKTDENYQRRLNGLKVIEKGSYILIKLTVGFFRQDIFTYNKILSDYYKLYTPQISLLIRENIKEKFDNGIEQN